MWNARIAVVGMALVLAACGSSSSTPLVTVDAVFNADPANSGFGIDGTSTNPGGIVAVGDSPAETVARGFYRFDISTLPAGAQVVSATLRSGMEAEFGAPFVEFGNLVVDHVNLGAALDNADFAAAAISTVIGALATNGTQEAKNMDVTTAVQADVAASRTTTDFRLYFVGAPDGETDQDFVHLTNQGTPGAVGVEPRLIVTYAVP